MDYQETYDEILTAIKGAAMPPPIIDVPEWSDRHIVLTSAESGFPGPWRSSMVPYLIEPMRSMSLRSAVRRVVLMFASQTAKTRALLNFLAWLIDCSPCPVLMLRPTLDDAKIFATQRLTHLFATPQLAKWISATKARDSKSTTLLRTFQGGLVLLAGGNSPVRLKSTPCRVLMADEIDTLPRSAGAEGDPLESARMRLTAFGERSKEINCSTPTIKGESRIEAEYEASSQGHWYMPCLHHGCGHMQELVYSQGDYHFFKWSGNPDGSDPDFRAWVECQKCGKEILEQHKYKMLQAGEWRHLFPGRNTKGYFANFFVQPPGWVAWRTIVEEILRARVKLAEGDTRKWRIFVNQRLALAWEDRGEELDPGTLDARAKEEWGERIPAGIRAITMGVDTQDDRLVAETVGWGLGKESWSLAFDVIQGDPMDVTTWEELTEIRKRVWVKQNGEVLKVDSCCIDTGGHRTQQVYDYVRSCKGKHVYAIKGMGGEGRAIWESKPREGGGKRGRPWTATGSFFLVGVNAAKYEAARYLKLRHPGPGYCHFPLTRAELHPDYFLQLTSERRIRQEKKKGRENYTWEVIKGRENHAWDARIYAIAALYALMSRGRVRLQGQPPVEDIDESAIGEMVVAQETLKPAPDVATEPSRNPSPEQPPEKIIDKTSDTGNTEAVTTFNPRKRKSRYFGPTGGSWFNR